MKAAVCPKYGPPEVLEIRDIKKPEPKDEEVLIKIMATSVTVADSRVRGFRVPPAFYIPARLLMGLTKPRQAVLGGELAGVVESAGSRVKNFRPGDMVVGFSGHHFGCNAEYRCLNESACLVTKPASLSPTQAVALPFGGLTALHFLQKARIKKAGRVLIYGASGNVGSYAVQLAKHFGAHVTAVCSTANLDMVKSLGADEVVDYTRQDFSKMDRLYSVVFDTVGKTVLSKTISVLTPDGFYLHCVSTPDMTLRARLALRGSSRKFVGGTFTPQAESLRYLLKLAEEGKIKPVIDQIYPLENIVDAHRYVDTGHKKGSVVLTL